MGREEVSVLGWSPTETQFVQGGDHPGCEKGCHIQVDFAIEGDKEEAVEALDKGHLASWRDFDGSKVARPAETGR